MAGFQLSTRRSESYVGLLVGLGAALALVGCGAPEGVPRAVPGTPPAALGTMPELSKGAAAVELGATVSGNRSAAGSVSPASAATLSSAVAPPVAPPAFELVGTSIDAHAAFAVLKGPDQRAVTVRQGDQIDGYTIASIESDRVELRSPANGQLILVLLDAPAGNVGAQAKVAPPASAPHTDLITEGINTDQSIPVHPTFGPTGQLMDGRRQIGH
jgi:hypothetical protein